MNAEPVEFFALKESLNGITQGAPLALRSNTVKTLFCLLLGDSFNSLNKKNRF